MSRLQHPCLGLVCLLRLTAAGPCLVCLRSVLGTTYNASMDGPVSLPVPVNEPIACTVDWQGNLYWCVVAHPQPGRADVARGGMHMRHGWQTCAGRVSGCVSAGLRASVATACACGTSAQIRRAPWLALVCLVTPVTTAPLSRHG